MGALVLLVFTWLLFDIGSTELRGSSRFISPTLIIIRPGEFGTTGAVVLLVLF